MSAATETMTNGRPRDLNPMRLKWYSTYSRRRTPHIIYCIYYGKQTIESVFANGIETKI